MKVHKNCPECGADKSCFIEDARGGYSCDVCGAYPITACPATTQEGEVMIADALAAIAKIEQGVK